VYRKNVASQNLPFVLIKATDGSALTGATVTARRSIDGGAQAAATGTVSELANGQYNLALSQADTNGNHIGILLTATNAIPVHFTLVTTAADPTDATAFGISRLDAAVTTRLAPTTAGRTLDIAATGEAGLDFDNIKDATGAHTLTNITVPLVTTVTGNVNGSVGSVTGAVGSVTGNVGGNVVGSVASVVGNVGGNVVGSVGSLTTNNDKTGYSLTTLESLALESGTAQAGGASTITLRAGASATDDLYKGQVVKVYGGTGVGQVRVISGYVGATKVATVDRAWVTQPDNTSTYAVLAVTTGKLNASLEVVAASVTGDVNGNLVGSIGSLSATAKGHVNAEVVDCLTTDTYAEPATVVPATSSIKDMLNWLKVLARNKITQTATTQTLRNDGDAGTISTSTASDDGTTFTRGKWV
jgi:hypothetical protein